MLEVKCGTADKSHENSFFRYFASQVKDHFERVGIEGILVGMPECRVRDNLQMDALLITNSSLTIIDFKDYDNCEVRLPDEADFENGRWLTNRDYYVKGGSSRNPYSQLMRQRACLKEILDRFCRHKTGQFDTGHITTMVCFTGKVTLSGSIPGWAKLKFFISDSESFLERIFDIANVHGVGLLESEFATRLFDRLFDAQPYECAIKPTATFIQEATDEPIADRSEELTPAAKPEGVALIREFFESDGDVLIISSIDRAERASLALAAQEEAHNAGFTEARILSSTKLAGDNLCAGLLQMDGSLYSEIYDSSSRSRGKDGKEHVSIGSLPNSYSLRYEDEALSITGKPETGAEHASERTAFIVCEGQLVSSSAWLDGPVVFGSGRLLSDVLQYLAIDGSNEGKNKIVFVGDDCQLGASSQSSSSMHAEAYGQELSVQELSFPQGGLSIDAPDFTTRLAACIREESRSILRVDDSSEYPRLAKNRAAERADIEDAARNWRTHKIVAYTNEQANNLNLYIKRSVLRNGEHLCQGDVLLFNAQFEAMATNPLQDGFPTRTIRNGEFATVTFVGSMPLALPCEGGESLTLIPIRFTPEGSTEEYEACIIDEYLRDPKAEFSPAQESAIQMRLTALERQERMKDPFGPGNPWFASMLQEGNYEERLDKKGNLTYWSKTDRRTLTPQERAYRKEIVSRLKSPGTEYFSVANSARARYGWAVTAHKAQSFLWGSVTLSANAPKLGRHSGQYFRFLYTGACHATQSLSIVRWHDITPFDETIVATAPSGAQRPAKRATLFRIDEGVSPSQAIMATLKSLGLDLTAIEHVGSSSYQERFRIVRHDGEATIAFSYNKRLEVGSVTRQKGDVGTFLAVKGALESMSSAESLSTPMAPAYALLRSAMGEGATVSVSRSTAYRDELDITVGGRRCMAGSYYNSKGLVTRFEMLSGDKEAFKVAENAIAQLGGV